MATEKQLASTVLMVRPAAFFANPETARSNRFQHGSDLPEHELQRLALGEFDLLADALSAGGVRVVVEDDTPQPLTPDAIFPNNWISTHADGTVVLYPMEAVSRRAERRADIVEALGSRHRFQVSEVIDLSGHESKGRFLEGTGSLVLDRVNHIAYACRSSRTNERVLREWAERLQYETVVFDAVDRHGVPIYHTNVMMSIGENLAMVCLEAIAEAGHKRQVVQSLEAAGRDLLVLNFGQMEQFAGNLLQLEGPSSAVTVLSETAAGSLEPGQRRQLEAGSTIVSAPIRTIERCSGGSVRCMLAEIHLPGMD